MYVVAQKMEKINCHRCGCEDLSRSTVYTNSAGTKLEKYRCMVCNYEYCVPDRNMYKVVESPTFCPVNGLRILIFKSDNKTIYWTNKDCKECEFKIKCPHSEGEIF